MSATRPRQRVVNANLFWNHRTERGNRIRSLSDDREAHHKAEVNWTVVFVSAPGLYVNRKTHSSSNVLRGRPADTDGSVCKAAKEKHRGLRFELHYFPIPRNAGIVTVKQKRRTRRRNIGKMYGFGIKPFKWFKRFNFAILKKKLSNVTKIVQALWPFEMTAKNQNYVLHVSRKLNYGNSCYHSAQNLLSFLPLYKRLEIKMHKTVPLIDALFQNCNCRIKLWTQQNFRKFENNALCFGTRSHPQLQCSEIIF